MLGADREVRFEGDPSGIIAVIELADRAGGRVPSDELEVRDLAVGQLEARRVLTRTDVEV